jgi:hypothetical protein
LFILGLLIAVFIPFDFGKKFGLGMVLVGIVMMIFFPLVVGWWNAYIIFRIAVFGIVLLAVIMFILFPGKKKTKVK